MLRQFSAFLFPLHCLCKDSRFNNHDMVRTANWPFVQLSPSEHLSAEFAPIYLASNGENSNNVIPHEAGLSINGLFLAQSPIEVMLKFPRRLYLMEKKHESGGCVGLRRTWLAASVNSSQWASSVALKEAKLLSFWSSFNSLCLPKSIQAI